MTHSSSWGSRTSSATVFGRPGHSPGSVGLRGSCDVEAGWAGWWGLIHLPHAECQDDLPSSARRPYKTTLLRRALVALEVEARETVMVGDREEDIALGVEIGCGTIGAAYGFGGAAELVRASARIDRFEALEGLVAHWNTDERDLSA